MRNAYYSPYDDEDMYAPPKRKPTPRRKQTFVQKAFDTARQDPKRFIGGAALFCIASTISLNALVMQTSRHPAPMFAQSAAPVPAAVVPATPVQPPPRPAETQATAPVPVPVPVQATANIPAAPRDVIGDIIRTGSTTPIPSQVQRNNVTASAQPTRTAAAPRTVAAPQPPQRRDAIGDLIRGNRPEAHPIASAPSTVEEVRKRKIAAVQQALNKLNYGPLPANGVMGPNTQKAIKRFEFDRRLPVTGTLNPQTLAELAATSRVAIR